MAAVTVTGSPTTRLAGNRPPSTTGVISSMTTRSGGGAVTASGSAAGRGGGGPASSPTVPGRTPTPVLAFGPWTSAASAGPRAATRLGTALLVGALLALFFALFLTLFLAGERDGFLRVAAIARTSYPSGAGRAPGCPRTPDPCTRREDHLGPGARFAG